MGLADINARIETMGGTWVKLDGVGEKFTGQLIDIDEVDRTTPDGDIVYKRGTQDPRKVWIVTFKVDDTTDPGDDGIRKFSANESAQAAIGSAVKELGRPLAEGDIIKLGVAAEGADTYSQKQYKAVIEKGISVPVVAPAPEEAEAEAVDLGF